MAFASPQDNLRELGLQPGMDVADLGAGPGHYALAAGKIVGEAGHVCAVEIQKDLVAKVKTEADESGLSHVDVIWSDLEKPEGSTLKDESVDAVILSNILFQISDKETVISEAYRILRPQGKLLVIDWSDSHDGLGPPEDHLVDSQSVTELSKSIGFIVSSDVSVGPHHWGVIFQKS